MKIAASITTVPERVDTLLPRTLRSLSHSEIVPTLITCDGDCKRPDYLSTHTKWISFPRRGHLSNWMSALFHLYIDNPKCDRYVVFEDDLITCDNLADYIIATTWDSPKAYWNLLTHDVNLLLLGKKIGWHPSNQRGKGAVGLVFTRQGVLDLITDSRFYSYLASNKRKCADGMVVQTLKHHGYKEYVHNPSLLQHIGEKSTLGHSYGKVSSFQGESFNPFSCLEGGANVSS